MSTVVKRKLAIIFAYNGAQFSGNQVQTEEGIRTVEPELEKALHEAGCISEQNFRHLHKISWTRSSRTDKGVHALSTVVGLKLLIDDRPTSAMIGDINARLPEDIRLISMKPVIQSFNAKTSCSYRKYEYLFPYSSIFPESSFSREVTEKLNMITERLQGTHNFHNYTRRLGFKSPQAQRYVVKFEVSNDPVVYQDTEYLKFNILGQSFLYHQIRNMIGVSIAVLTQRLTLEDLEKSFMEESMVIPLAPPHGLALAEVLFPVYNKKNPQKPVENTQEEQARIDEFYWSSVVPTIHSHLEEFNQWCALEFRAND